MLLPTIHLGNCLQHMREVIPAGSVHCVCSSPPYWGLRDYGIQGVQWSDGWTGVYGLEPTVELYVAHTVELFEGIRRVLRDDGVVFWNLGDTYATGAGKAKNPGSQAKHRGVEEGVDAYPTSQPNRMPQSVKSGNKMLVPYRVAIALQDAGWIVRQDNIWHKRSPMPESVSGWRWIRCRRKVATSSRAAAGTYHAEATGKPHGDRDGRDFASGAVWEPCSGCEKCEANGGYVLRRGSWRTTTAHEVILMITKSDSYFCDGDAASEVAIGGTPGNVTHRGKTAYESGDQYHRTKVGLCNVGARETRNPRSVWTMSSEPYKGAHFATFPTEIPFRCIKSATSSAGCCPHCGSQWAPIVNSERVATRPGTDTKTDGRNSHEMGNRDPHRHVQISHVEGYRQTCNCPEHEPIPSTVYDPFTGSGTTLQVAYHMGRNAIGSEIGDQYLPLIQQRIQLVPKCLTRKGEQKVRVCQRKTHSREQLLF